MKKTLTTSAALLLTTTAATAGGLERAANTFGPLFEDGNYAELSYGQVTPDVTGSVTVPTAAGAVEIDSGNVGESYGNFGAAIKYDVDANVSVALIFDQPYGANVAYPEGTGYPQLAGATGEINSSGVTVLGKYQFNENYSFYFGPRAVSMDGSVIIGAYDAVYAEDTAFGYVVGAAYERPEIALRVALTYSSELAFSHDTTVLPGGSSVRVDVPATEYTLPETITLDFQSGVAENTLVFGSIRYADWTVTEINSFGFPGNPIVSYSDPVTTYTLGVGRKFTEQFSGAVSVSYEAENDGIASNLAPTDGFTSISLGGTYDVGNGLEVTGGVRYIMVGDAVTALGPLSPEFSDNSAVAFGLSVGYRF